MLLKGIIKTTILSINVLLYASDIEKRYTYIDNSSADRSVRYTILQKQMVSGNRRYMSNSDDQNSIDRCIVYLVLYIKLSEESLDAKENRQIYNYIIRQLMGMLFIFNIYYFFLHCQKKNSPSLTISIDVGGGGVVSKGSLKWPQKLSVDLARTNHPTVFLSNNGFATQNPAT